MEYSIGLSCVECGFKWGGDYRDYIVEELPMNHHCKCEDSCKDGCDDCNVEECDLMLTGHYTKEDEVE